MPSYDSQGRLKIINANSASTGSGGGAIAIASGSNGVLIDTDATFINFEGTATELVEVSGSGVSLTLSKNPVKGFRGFSTSSYWSTPIAGTNLSGSNAGFEVVVAAIPNRILGATTFPRALVSNMYLNWGEGYELGFTDVRPSYTSNDASLTRGQNYTPNWHTSNPIAKPLLLLSFAWDGSTRYLKIGGRTIQSAAQATFGFNTVLPFVIGKNAQSADRGATDCTIVSVAFKANGILQDEEWNEILRTFAETGDLPNSSFTSRWSASDLPTGSAPSTLPDKIGTNNLTLSGTIEVVRDGHFTVPSFIGWATVASELASTAFGDVSSTYVQSALEEIRYSSGPLEILSGSTGTQVTSSAYFINFDGTGVESVNVTGSGVTVTINGGSGGITIASGSSGTIVDSDATFINFQGSAVSSVALSGSGVTVNVNHTPYADFLTGFGEGASDADINVWQMSYDPLSGSANWAVGIIYCRTSWNNGEYAQRIWSTSNQFLVGGGTTFVMEDILPIVTVVTSSSTFSATAAGSNSNRSYCIFVVTTYDGGFVSIYQNGFFANGVAGNDTGIPYTESGFPFTVGGSAQPTNTTGAEDWGVHAVGYVTRSVSQEEIMHWWRHVYVSGTLVDVPNASGNGLNGAWRVTTGINPSTSTWTPFIGVDNLVKTGSKAHATQSIALKW